MFDDFGGRIPSDKPPIKTPRELAVERQLEALFRDIGWIETGLSELGDGARP